MGKFPKFLAARNPMAEPDAVYIYHTRAPRFLSKVIDCQILIVDDVDSMLDYYKGNQDKVAGLLRRLEDWYKAYEINNRHFRG